MQGPRDRAADAARGAGHQGRLSGQVEHHSRFDEGFDLVRRADRDRRQGAVDPLDEAGEHPPGADLDDLLDLLGGE